MPEIILDQYALTTVEAVKQAGSGIDDDDPNLENAIRGEINAVSRRVKNYGPCEFTMPLSQVTASDGAMTAGSPILTSASASFQAGDVGKAIVVYGGAGILGPVGMLDTTILSQQSATQVTLANSAVNTVTAAQYVYGSVTRMFTLGPDGYGNGLVDFGPYVAQTVSAVTIDTQGGSVGTALSSAAVDYQPITVPEWDGVYNSATIYSWSGSSTSTVIPWNVERQVEVTGLWGWPQVPADVENAVIGQVIDNVNASYRIITNSPISGDVVEPGTVRRSGMNAQLRSTLDYYKRWVIVG